AMKNTISKFQLNMTAMFGPVISFACARCESRTRSSSKRCPDCSRVRSKPMRRKLCYPIGRRSEEHTSELQSLAYLVCRLLLEKKNKCRALVSLNQVIKEIIFLQLLK